MSDFIEKMQERHGLFRNVPRSLRRAVERYLVALEANPARLDCEALENYASLKRLHTLLHVKPGDRARALLFGKLAASEARAGLRQLARTRDPRVAAELVRQHRFPYLVVQGALKQITPAVAVALVEVLDAGELFARLPLLVRRCPLDDAIRAALRRRLTGLAREGTFRFTYQQVESLVRKAGLDRQLATAAFELLGTAGAASTLQGHTALLVDASGSVRREGGCLDLAARVGRQVDQVLAPEARLLVYLFGLEGWAGAVRRGSGLDQWRSTLTVPTPTVPGTSVGAGLEKLREHGQEVDRLLILTDGYENRPPRLVSAYERYCTGTGLRPSVNLVQPAGAGQQLAMDLRNAQVPFSVFTLDEHLLGLEGLIPALAAQAQQDRVAQILSWR